MIFTCVMWSSLSSTNFVGPCWPIIKTNEDAFASGYRKQTEKGLSFPRAKFLTWIHAFFAVNCCHVQHTLHRCTLHLHLGHGSHKPLDQPRHLFWKSKAWTSFLSPQTLFHCLCRRTNLANRELAKNATSHTWTKSKFEHKQTWALIDDTTYIHSIRHGEPHHCSCSFAVQARRNAANCGKEHHNCAQVILKYHRLLSHKTLEQALTFNAIVCLYQFRSQFPLALNGRPSVSYSIVPSLAVRWTEGRGSPPSVQQESADGPRSQCSRWVEGRQQQRQREGKYAHEHMTLQRQRPQGESRRSLVWKRGKNPFWNTFPFCPPLFCSFFMVFCQR